MFEIKNGETQEFIVFIVLSLKMWYDINSIYYINNYRRNE